METLEPRAPIDMREVTALFGIDRKTREYYEVTFEIPDDTPDTEEAIEAAFRALHGANIADAILEGEQCEDGDYEYDDDSIALVEVSEESEDIETAEDRKA